MVVLLIVLGFAVVATAPAQVLLAVFVLYGLSGPLSGAPAQAKKIGPGELSKRLSRPIYQCRQRFWMLE